jgi:hypothetical protein
MTRVLSACCTSLLLLTLSACSSGGPGGGCTGGAIDRTCDGSQCGGDPTGVWRLVTYCGPTCVVGLAETLYYGSDNVYGYNGGKVGTWEIKDGSLLQTVSGVTGGGAFCVVGDRMWKSEFANCGSGSGPVNSTWQRDCGGDAGY